MNTIPSHRSLVYLNGEFIPGAEARVSIFDRGFLFADGVYDVCAVVNSKLVDNHAHLQRLMRSLREVQIDTKITIKEIEAIQIELVEKNAIDEGIVYLQFTRGESERDFDYPKAMQPTFLVFTQKKSVLHNPMADRGLEIITMEDVRWQRRTIKSIGLLAAVLAKQTATEAGVDDVWWTENGLVNEGSSSNAFIINAKNQIVTHPLDDHLLHGVTRAAVAQFASGLGLELVEASFTVEEAMGAKEAFNTSASKLVMPVIRINGETIGDGSPGPLTRKLRELYISRMVELTA